MPALRLTAVAVGVGLAAAATACGGVTEGDGGYAHLTRDAAVQQAMNGLSSVVNDEGSGLYGHRLRFASVQRAVDATGRQVWLVRVSDRTARRTLCVHVWLSVTPIGTSPHTNVGTCPVARPRLPARTETTTHHA